LTPHLHMLLHILEEALLLLDFRSKDRDLLGVLTL
jgi:hypothetical protein